MTVLLILAACGVAFVGWHIIAIACRYHEWKKPLARRPVDAL